MQVAVLGLGRMGMQIAKRLQRNNFEVLTWNRSEAPRKEFDAFGGKSFEHREDLVNAMNGEARIFWVMLPQEIIEEFVFSENGLLSMLKPGDILIEGGNSFYKETVRRSKLAQQKNIIMFDSGTSGGVWGEQRGFALMVGGPEEHWSKVENIFKTLSSGTNYGLVGPNGSGHFVKMVHNGIEYGMMEAIAEGYSIMEASEFKPDLAKVTKIYQKGSVG
jgi:6-phosphogluconate dehydrogenase